VKECFFRGAFPRKLQTTVYTMKVHKRRWGTAPLILYRSARRIVSVQHKASAALPPQNNSGSHQIRGWVGPSTGLDVVAREKSLHLPGFQPGSSSPYPRNGILNATPILFKYYGTFFFQCHHMSLMDFAVSPPGCGRSLTNFWSWDAHEAQLRCPDEVNGDTRISSTRRGLKPKFY
jgi:hypothetical protein